MKQPCVGHRTFIHGKMMLWFGLGVSVVNQSFDSPLLGFV
jgi:hypothetical protein